MATKTPNYKLTKPEMTDIADISMINQNWDTLDTALKANADNINEVKQGDIPDVENAIKALQSLSTLTWISDGLPENSDFNTVPPGIYGLGGSGKYQNGPGGSIFGILLVLARNDLEGYRFQCVWQHNNTLSIRAKGDTWSAWRTI